MKTRERIEQWNRLKADGAMSEDYYARTVVIRCNACDERWERPREGGRRCTIADREDAIRHMASAHEQAAG